MKSKESLIAEILAELYEMGRWKVKGGVIHIETIQDKQMSNGEHRESRERKNGYSQEIKEQASKIISKAVFKTREGVKI